MIITKGTTKTLKIKEVQEIFFMRMGLNRQNVEALKGQYTAKADIPPIRVGLLNNVYYLIDGRHRFEALKSLHSPNFTITVEVSPATTREQMYVEAVAANLGGPLQATAEECEMHIKEMVRRQLTNDSIKEAFSTKFSAKDMDVIIANTRGVIRNEEMRAMMNILAEGKRTLAELIEERKPLGLGITEAKYNKFVLTEQGIKSGDNPNRTWGAILSNFTKGPFNKVDSFISDALDQNWHDVEGGVFPPEQGLKLLDFAEEKMKLIQADIDGQRKRLDAKIKAYYKTPEGKAAKKLRKLLKVKKPKIA